MDAKLNQLALLEALGSGARRNVMLAPFTSMRVGGPADVLMVADEAEELARAVRLATEHDVPWLVLGSGCNVLISEQGVRGLVVVNRTGAISFTADGLRVASGAQFSAVARQATERGLAGLAWAVGLPGTVGGALVGNAGAFGGDVADTLRSATMLDPDGRVEEKASEWFEFRYRGSRLKGASIGPAAGRGGNDGPETRDWVVLEAEFDLQPGDVDALRARAKEILSWRRTRHPSGATMGSTFKNPSGSPAGLLLEQAGLKGHRIGGAEVSEQHANFLINSGNATANEVWALIEHARAEVERQFGVVLELEIELLGWNGKE